MRPATVFEALIAPHLPDLRRYCRSLAKSAWDAEDLYQEALLKAFVYFRNVPAERITRSFLLGAARLQWIDRYRKERRRGPAPERVDRTFDADYAEIRGILEWMAEHVPPRHLEMWLLAEYFGYSMREIANQLETTVPAVKSSLFRTKRCFADSRQRRAGARPGGEIAPPMRVERWVRAVLREEPRQLTV